MQHLPPTLQRFQTVVWKNQETYRDVQSLALLLAEPQFRALISADMARVLLSEAVDCHARSEDIAHNWFRAAILLTEAAENPLVLHEGRIASVVQDIVAVSHEDLAAALWSRTSCGCLDPPVASPVRKRKSISMLGLLSRDENNRCWGF